jgi:hypothetical protein
MYLAYMDEAGNTGRKADADQPVHMLGCLLVEDSCVRPLEDAIAAVATKHFPKLSTKSDFEFHGALLYSGKGIFRGCPPAARIAAMRDLIEVTAQHSAAFGYTGVNKVKSYANDHPHRIAFTLLVERLEPWLKARDALALIVADENHEVDQNLITDMEWFKQHSTSWGYVHVKIERVIDSIHFVKSHNNRLIQACDVLTYMRLKNHLLSRAKIDAFIALPHPRQQLYPDWRDANSTLAEKATMEMGELINKITSFRAKVWPD